MPDSDTGDGSAAPAAANVWSLAIALVVVSALIVLTVFLVRHYEDVKDAASILGIAAPVLAAAVGVALGFAAGGAKGKADGEKNAKNFIKAKLADKLAQAEQAVRDLVSKIQLEGASQAGTDGVTFEGQSLGDRSVEFSAAELQSAQDAVRDARAAVEGL